MNVEDSIWDKLTRVVIGLLLLAFLVAIGVWYLPLIRQNERIRREVMRLDAQVQKESETKRQLNAAVESLSNDPRLSNGSRGKTRARQAGNGDSFRRSHEQSGAPQ